MIFKKGQWRPVPLPLFAHPRVWINMHQYFWISPTILQNACIMFRLCQGSECAWSSYMLNRLLRMSWVLIVSEFWIWYCCICRGYIEFWIFLNMTQYALIMLEYDSVCLNIRQYSRTWLNIAECLWIDLTMSE